MQRAPVWQCRHLHFYNCSTKLKQLHNSGPWKFRSNDVNKRHLYITGTSQLLHIDRKWQRNASNECPLCSTVVIRRTPLQLGRTLCMFMSFIVYRTRHPAPVLLVLFNRMHLLLHKLLQNRQYRTAHHCMHMMRVGGCGEANATQWSHQSQRMFILNMNF